MHRVLKSILRGDIEKLYTDYHKSKMTQIAKHSSTQEQNSDKCERQSNKMKAAEYMKNYIGEVYPGKISGFTNSGMYVELENLIEGRIGYDTMNDFYDYNEEMETLVGEKTKKVYRLGDEVEVKVVKASKELIEIDFELEKPKVRTRKVE